MLMLQKSPCKHKPLSANLPGVRLQKSFLLVFWLSCSVAWNACHVCMYACMYVWMYACMYVSVLVCMYLLKFRYVLEYSDNRNIL